MQTAGAVGLLVALVAAAACGDPGRHATASSLPPVPPPPPPSPFAGPPPALSPALSSLQGEIERIAASARGVLGVMVFHIESAEQVGVRETEPFPMASISKIPIALQYLHRIDLGHGSLDDAITITEAELRPGRSLMPGRFSNGAATIVSRELVRLMIVKSDNTSADAILRLAGGPAAVSARMRALGVAGVRVDRSMMEMMLDEMGVTDRPPPDLLTFPDARRLLDQSTVSARREGVTRFVMDARDTATPRGMVHLLTLIHRRLGLQQSNADWLVELMEQAGRRRHRLNALLPPAVAVARKTGTLECCINDVGIVRLPNGNGHLAIAAFAKVSDGVTSGQQAAIARIASAAYDYWSGDRSRLPEAAADATRPATRRHR